MSVDNKDQILMEKILERIRTRTQKINQDIYNNPEISCLPLRQFSHVLLTLKVKTWVNNDIRYTENLKNVMKILAKNGLSGKKIVNLGVVNVKMILENEFTSFMTVETFNIMFEKLKQKILIDKNYIKTKSFAEVGWILFNYPLENLLDRIIDPNDPIDGQVFIQLYQSKNDKWIKGKTGYSMDEIYQIQSVLFRHKTLQRAQIEDNLLTSLSSKFSTSSVKRMQKCIHGFDLEQLHFKIKNGQNISDFSDTIANLIEDLIEENRQKHNESVGYDLAFLGDDIIKRIYTAIAEAFISYNYDDIEPFQQMSRIHSLSNEDVSINNLNLQQDWICNECGNYNFNQYIDSKMNVTLTICRLCGITKKDSVIIALMNKDTYMRVNEKEKVIELKEQKNNQKKSDIDKHEQHVQDMVHLERENFDLSCLDRTDNEPCPHILRLARYLLIYKQWLQVVYAQKKKDDINQTIKVDIKKYVSNDRFKDMFIESAKNVKQIMKKQNIIDELQAILDKNVMNIEIFLSLQRKEFFDEISKYTKNIKLSHGLKLFRTLTNGLKNLAQTVEFGKFLTDLDFDSIDADYHHILRVHINEGNKITIENVFRFFETTCHWFDLEDDIANCRSIKRKETRIHKLEIKTNSSKNIHFTDFEEQKLDKITEDKASNVDSDNKDAWSLKQYYIQSQLDVMHTFLVHTDWKAYIKEYLSDSSKQLLNNKQQKGKHVKTSSLMLPLYDRQITTNETQDIEMGKIRGSISARDTVALMTQKNSTKYITKQSSTKQTKYGFGVDHSHIHLKPEFECLRSELINNKLCAVSVINCDHLLTKSIKKHKIALIDFKTQLICKYFKSEYNIIRNEPIGIRHILALIIYTDLSTFCTKFRETYRKMKENETEDEITKRHVQLYWYSRFLFESIEFFGKEMNENLTVYHGLNCVLNFYKFTAFFHQPISTTTSFITAQQFSDGVGIILKLRCGSKSTSKNNPKFLSVSWLSDFPSEDEKLFYGENIVFSIIDIIEAKTNTGHGKELIMLNNFQKMVKNQIVNWTDNENENKMIFDLVKLIEAKTQKTKQQNLDILTDEKEEEKYNGYMKSYYITKYGRELFDYFCSNKNRQWICIKNFKSLPLPLKNALFIAETK
eukprot:306906_1